MVEQIEDSSSTMQIGFIENSVKCTCGSKASGELETICTAQTIVSPALRLSYPSIITIFSEGLHHRVGPCHSPRSRTALRVPPLFLIFFRLSCSSSPSFGSNPALPCHPGILEPHSQDLDRRRIERDRSAQGP